MSQPIQFFRFRMRYRKYLATILLVICLPSTLISIVSAQPLDTFDSLVEQYAELMLGGYEQDGFEDQIESLIAKTIALRDLSGSPEVTYLVARMLYGYTETQGMLGVFRLLKESRDGLEKALAIDDQNLTNNYLYSYRFVMVEDYVSARQQLLKARSLQDPDTRWPKWQTLVLQQIDADLVKVEARL